MVPCECESVTVRTTVLFTQNLTKAILVTVVYDCIQHKGTEIKRRVGIEQSAIDQNCLTSAGPYSADILELPKKVLKRKKSGNSN